MLEPNGSAAVYDYDAAGRLADLRDGSGNLLVSYTYNAANKLVSAEMGNGTSTTYSYDAAGNVTQILDHAADGSVTANFTYTYDAVRGLSSSRPSMAPGHTDITPAASSPAPFSIQPTPPSPTKTSAIPMMRQVIASTPW